MPGMILGILLLLTQLSLTSTLGACIFAVDILREGNQGIMIRWAWFWLWSCFFFFLVVLCDRISSLCPHGCLPPPSLSTPQYLILPAFPSSRSLLMLVPVGSWDALPHLPICCNLVLSCRNLHPRRPQ